MLWISAKFKASRFVGRFLWSHLILTLKETSLKKKDRNFIMKSIINFIKCLQLSGKKSAKFWKQGKNASKSNRNVLLKTREFSRLNLPNLAKLAKNFAHHLHSFKRLSKP